MHFAFQHQMDVYIDGSQRSEQQQKQAAKWLIQKK